MKIVSNNVIKEQCKFKLKCLTGTRKKCKCVLVGEMKDKSRDTIYVDLALKIELIQTGVLELKEKGLNLILRLCRQPKHRQRQLSHHLRHLLLVRMSQLLRHSRLYPLGILHPC